MERHEPLNNGGKQNLPKSPVQIEAIRKLDDKKYSNLLNIVNGVERLLNELDDESLTMINLRYWECPLSCNGWQGVANQLHVSKTTVLRRRNVILDKLAEYIGYV